MTTVPLFPLNTVLFPGTSTSLHIFEERYRALVADLSAIPDPAERVFVVVAIREGYEVGPTDQRHGAQSLHQVGTLVQMTGSERYPDGRYDIEVTARSRAEILEVDRGDTYARALIELTEPLDAPGGRSVRPHAGMIAEVGRTLAVFDRYRSEVAALDGAPAVTRRMPSDPLWLSYSLASSCVLGLHQRQTLLEAPDAFTRLRLLRRILIDEIHSMIAVPSLPVTEIARTRWSPN